MVRTKMVGEDYQGQAALKSHVTPLVPKLLNYSRLDQLLPIFPVHTELPCILFDKKS